MERQELRKYVWVVQALIIAFGLGLIICSALFGRSVWWGATVNSLGAAVISATLLSILQSRLEIDPVSLIEQRLNLNQQIQRSGLKAIHLRLADEAIFNSFERAHTIDLMFITGKNTLHRHLGKIEKAIRERGCRVRLLICDPANEILNNEPVSESLCPGTDIVGEIDDVSTQIERFLRRLRGNDHSPSAGSLELRYFNSVPTVSILIVDNLTARFTSYLPYSNSSEAPSFDVTSENEGTLFSIFRATFNDVWSQATPVFMEDYSLRLEHRPPLDRLQAAAQAEPQIAVSPATSTE